MKNSANTPSLFESENVYNVKEPQNLQAAEVTLQYRRTVNYKSLGVMNNSEKASEIFRSIFPDGGIEYREYFYVMLIDRAGHLLGLNRISEGGTAATSVDVKLIMQAAILSNSSSIILCHNHPSGTLRPSEEDKRITKKIYEAGRIMDINVNDHIILTADSYYSFSDNGLM